MSRLTKATIFGLLLSAFYIISAHCDTPTLRRRTEPPTPTISCADELHSIRRALVDVSLNEAILWEGHNDRKTANFFLGRAHTAQYTHDLDFNLFNCAPSNLKELRTTNAIWQYMYFQDMENFNAGK